MHISEIRVQKYKSINKPRTIVPKDGLNVFIGKNNAGKSTILDGLFQFFRPLQDPERFADSEARLEANVEFTPKDRSALGKLGLTSVPEEVTLQLTGSELSYKTTDEKKALPPQLSQFLVQRTIRIGAVRDLDFVKMKKLFEEFSHGYPRAFKLFITKLQVFFPEIKTPNKLFHEKRDGVETTVKEFGKSRSIERLGLGFRHLFIILLYYYHPRYDVVLIDEPEIHQHPQMIKRLLDIFMDNPNEKQMFITTHSPLFVQPRDLTHIFRTVRTEEEGTVFYFLEKEPSDSSRLVQELNADNGQMFLADHVLLVEGVSDRIFVRNLLSRWYDPSVDVKVIPVHGKENVDIYSELLDSFHIPHWVLLDKDAYNDHSMAVIKRHTKGLAFEKGIQKLKEHNIYVLPFGNLEQHYPKHLYQRDVPKPLLALHVSEQIKEEEMSSERMQPLKELLDSITLSSL